MKIVCLVSGGMDSVTMLYKMRNLNSNIIALSFDYGQRHIRELESAKASCEKLGVKHLIMDLPKWHSCSALSSKDAVMPVGHYTDENMKSTVVANRNMIFLSIAIGVAIDRDYTHVAYGAHSGDHTIYPDCRPEFFSKMRDVAMVCDFKKIHLFAPYLMENKITILTEGIKLGVDYSLTWTCYIGESKPCGKCGACQERAEAFRLNKLDDPLL